MRKNFARFLFYLFFGITLSLLFVAYLFTEPELSPSYVVTEEHQQVKALQHLYSAAKGTSKDGIPAEYKEKVQQYYKKSGPLRADLQQMFDSPTILNFQRAMSFQLQNQQNLDCVLRSIGKRPSHCSISQAQANFYLKYVFPFYTFSSDTPHLLSPNVIQNSFKKSNLDLELANLYIGVVENSMEVYLENRSRNQIENLPSLISQFSCPPLASIAKKELDHQLLFFDSKIQSYFSGKGLLWKDTFYDESAPPIVFGFDRAITRILVKVGGFSYFFNPYQEGLAFAERRSLINQPESQKDDEFLKLLKAKELEVLQSRPKWGRNAFLFHYLGSHPESFAISGELEGFKQKCSQLAADISRMSSLAPPQASQ